MKTGIAVRSPSMLFLASLLLVILVSGLLVLALSLSFPIGLLVMSGAVAAHLFIAMFLHHGMREGLEHRREFR